MFTYRLAIDIYYTLLYIGRGRAVQPRGAVARPSGWYPHVGDGGRCGGRWWWCSHVERRHIVRLVPSCRWWWCIHVRRSPVRPTGALMSVVVVGVVSVVSVVVVGGGAATWSGRPSVRLVPSRLVVVWLVVGARAYTHAAPPLRRARWTGFSAAALFRPKGMCQIGYSH